MLEIFILIGLIQVFIFFRNFIRYILLGPSVNMKPIWLPATLKAAAEPEAILARSQRAISPRALFFHGVDSRQIL